MFIAGSSREFPAARPETAQRPVRGIPVSYQTSTATTGALIEKATAERAAPDTVASMFQFIVLFS